jgi:hypothetical protein
MSVVRGGKGPLYARFGIWEAWLVDEDVWDLSTYFVLSRSSDTKGYPSVGIGPFRLRQSL